MKQLFRSRWGRALICAATSLLGMSSADAASVTLNAAADTFIVNGFPDYNAGASGWFDVGADGGLRVRRGLLKFNVSGIPAGSTINSAVLSASTARVPPGAQSSTIDVYRLLVSWGEGAQVGLNGSTAVAGECTWNARLSGTTNWTTAGAMDDVAASSSASSDAGFGGTVSWSGAGLTADVQAWVDTPSTNNGWLLVSQDEGVFRSVRGFYTKEGGSAPTLQITYTAPPPPNQAPTVAITSPTNGFSQQGPSAVTIQATASDSDGTVSQVEFFDGATSLGVDSTAPYSIAPTLAIGSHTLSAVATDNSGASSTSAVVTISITSSNFSNPIAARIPKGNITVELKPIADGMISPIGMAVPDDGSGRMFVYDQIGIVWLITPNGRSPLPVLDVRTRLMNLTGSYDERGLLGIAVHTNFAQYPYLYTYTSEPNNGVADFPNVVTSPPTNNHQSVIAEWRFPTSSSNQVDVSTRREIMRVDEPQSNHNGGTMRFGPDGLLYVTFGDGGQANDVGNGHTSPGGNAQDFTNILGSIIRIDVNGSNSANGKYGVPLDNPFVGVPGVDEIYAYGLRNPFNFSFDRGSGLLYLGDVGQNFIEEIDIISKGSNYGWNIKEGSFFFVPSTGGVTNTTTRTLPPNLVDPIAQYDHDDGTAVIGGYVYRGSSLPALSGRYVFGDWGTFAAPSGRLFYLDADNNINELRIGLNDRPLGYYLKGFGEDASGELYLFGSKSGPQGNSGIMFKLVPPPASALGVVSASITNGTNVAIAVAGGVGPVAQQRKLVLNEPFCMTEMFLSTSRTVTPVRGSSGFFRHVDTANQPAAPFTAALSGANERPTPLNNGSSGFGIFRLEGNTLIFTITYKGLSGAPTAAHFHAPATAGVAASVAIDLAPYHTGPYASSSGSFSGAIVLTDNQKAQLMAGLMYVNIHTSANPGGETRGQVAPVNFEASLLSAYETPAINANARGFGTFTLVGTQLTFNVTYSGLTSPASAAHIHGSAPIGQSAGVLIDLAPYNGGGFGSSGVLSGTINLTPAQLAAVVDGLTYVNFHTAANGGGELRGQIVPQSTAIPFTSWISGTNERPQLVNGSSGLGLFSIEGNSLRFNISYNGLSGAPTAAHIHGPSVTTSSAGVAIDLFPFANGTLGTSGSFSGVQVLTPAQRSMILSGQAYVNIHTSSNPNGETRGNINTVLMNAFATGTAERPASTVTTGSALGMFTLVSTQLTMNVVYTGLSGAASASHIHAPASASATGGVVIDFAPYNGGSYGVSGAVSGSLAVTPAILGYLIDGLSYINFHTTANSGGEIRGQIGR